MSSFPLQNMLMSTFLLSYYLPSSRRYSHRPKSIKWFAPTKPQVYSEQTVSLPGVKSLLQKSRSMSGGLIHCYFIITLMALSPIFTIPTSPLRNEV